MATLYTHQEQNIWKTWFLMATFFGLVMLIGWVVSWYYDNPSILYIAVIFSVMMNITSYWFSDKIVLKLAGARPATREEYSDLWNIVENLSITAGLPMPKLYIVNDPSPNAFATGRNKEHAVVAVTTGILPLLNKVELEGVIAHELSHIGNRDMLVSTVAVVLAGFVTILSDIFLRSLHFGGGRGGDRKGSGVLVIVGIVLAILAPIFAMLIRLAVSRKRESLADASGALLTRYPEGLASALLKISASAQPMHVSKAIAHLYISDPFAKQPKTSFFAKLFMTHPPVEERVAALRGNQLTQE
ncbi:MAG: M48 family metallopeptidase [bacterium]|nr:M48 family metallopeptidase [bacterium]